MEIFVEKDVDLIIAEVSHYIEIIVSKNKLVHENAVTYSGLWAVVIFVYCKIPKISPSMYKPLQI